ncbi:MAG TPA: hypothetical protein VKB93_28445 [Thermoanaerobaculia bacterium]|nr:hypothetical protein [Thermoanaerobaculia bacterium]
MWSVVAALCAVAMMEVLASLLIRRAFLRGIGRRPDRAQALASLHSRSILVRHLEAIRDRIGTDARTAQAMIAEFSELLRPLLRTAHASDVALHEELAIVAHAVAFDDLRRIHGLELELDIDPVAAEARVPVLLVQALISTILTNSLDDGTANLTVRARITGEFLRIDASYEPCMVRPIDSRPLQEWLTLLFGKRASVHFSQPERTCIGQMQLPFRTKSRDAPGFGDRARSASDESRL